MFSPLLFHLSPLCQMDTAQFLDFQIQKTYWDHLACFQQPLQPEISSTEIQKYRKKWIWSTERECWGYRRLRQ